jgi:hypothetical protein
MLMLVMRRIMRKDRSEGAWVWGGECDAFETC